MSETSDSTDPILSTANSLMTLGSTERETNIELRDKVAQALKHHVVKIEQDDFSGMELLLTCQAQMLHKIFTQSAEKYAATDANHYHHAMIALMAQNYCRMTITTLKYLKSTPPPPEKRGTNYYDGGLHEEVD